MAFERKTFTCLVDVSVDDDLSAAVALGEYQPLCLASPATLEANTERLLFHVSLDGTTYNILKDKDGTIYAVTVAATNTNKATNLDPAVFAGWRYVKIGTYQSDESTAVSQTADRTLYIGAGKVVW